MKKFILFKNNGEVKKVYEGCTLEGKNEYYPERIKEFNNKEDAIKELSKYNTIVTDYRSYFLVEEYYIEELEEDNNGDFIGGDIWDFSKLPDKYSKFYINEKNESAYSFKKYTFEEVKDFFKHEEESDTEYISKCHTIEEENKMIDDCIDVDELLSVLTTLAYGLEFTYKIEKC